MEQKNVKAGPADQLSESDSDTGLPPPPKSDQLNQKMKMAIPSLKITGLGMSTLSNNASGLTAEQLADQELISNAKNNMSAVKNGGAATRTS